MQPTKNIIFDLKKLSIIKVEGEDAHTFLQGQITNDISIATPTQSIHAGFCNPKGRLLAFFHIIKYLDSYLLICSASIAENITKKLSMYVLRSRVKVELNPKGIMYFGALIGNQDECISLEGKLPTTPMEVANQSSLTIIRLHGDIPRLLFIGEKNDCLNFIEKNCSQFEEKSFNDWSLQNIKSGIPSIYHETQEQFIPQSINLDIIGAINFKKGCYTGQEIVARTHYLGKPKRRMYIASFQGTQDLVWGAVITSNGDPVGQVVDFSNLGDNQSALLIEIRIESSKSTLMIGASKLVLPVPEMEKFSS
ncbi:MAG: folate-binding protein YgfZ [Methylophilales bacterium]|nr:folate-binding protein YgfZ [Methylophilales bacterium]